MIDIVDKETRRIIMSRVRSKNTVPEILLRKALFARGFRSCDALDVSQFRHARINHLVEFVQGRNHIKRV